MSQSIREALEYLNQLIQKGGWEFPDAAHHVARMFRVDQSMLEQAYDNQP